MSHPGPPRFVAAGDEVELAPRDPNPDAAYDWTLVRRPEGSVVTLGDDAVEHLVPDVAGTYVARLSAPDGVHDLTIRAFPEAHDPVQATAYGASGERDETVVGRQATATENADEYAPATDEGGDAAGRPRLTLSPSVEGDEAVVRAETSPHPDGTERPVDLTVEFLVDDRDDVTPGALRTDGHELRVPLTALPDRARIHAVAVGEGGYSVPDAVTFTREAAQGRPAADGAVTTSRPYDPPEWAENAFVYEIYVRTFAGQAADEGSAETSTFDALVDRLDYVASLGVDVVWLTPILENDHAPHGYNVTDFFAVADDLGSREEYERFVEAAHDRGLRVLFDLVCNHSARTHPFFESAVEHPDGEYRDWYEWRTATDPETYFDWEHIANFDFDHLAVRRHLLDVVDEWAPLVDGFRCDMAWAVPDGFWREIHDRCKARDPEFLLLDETIPYIPEFQAGLFDVHFDSTTYFALREAGRGADAETVLDAVEGRAEIGFPDHAAFMLYAENHDETRYVTECGRPAAEAAMGAVFTLPGAPMVYAGQEFGQRGKRDDLAWAHADEDLQAFVRSLSRVRHGQPALSAGADLRRIAYDVREGDPGAVVAYGRVTDDAAVVAVLHFGEGTAVVSVPAATDTTDLVTGTDRGRADDTAAQATTVSVDSVVLLPGAPGLSED
jgi:cyclomaltodextrinase